MKFYGLASFGDAVEIHSEQITDVDVIVYARVGPAARTIRVGKTQWNVKGPREVEFMVEIDPDEVNPTTAETSDDGLGAALRVRRTRGRFPAEGTISWATKT